MVRRIFSRFVFAGLLALPLMAATSLTLPLTTIEAQASQASDAAERALAGDFSAAISLAKNSGDPAAIKLVELLYLKDQGQRASYSRIMSFLSNAPKWPLSESLLKRAEQSMFLNGASPETVRAHFVTRKPLTAEGMFALAKAKISIGDASEGKALLRAAWGRSDFDLPVERKVLDQLGNHLTANDHKHRMWRLILAQEPNAAIRAAKRVGGAYPQAAEAAQHLLRGVAGAERKHASLPASLRDAAPMHYVLARYYRKLEKYAKARAVLSSIPADAATMVDADAFWTERRIIARRSVGPRLKEHWSAAYKIASNHGLTAGENAVEAEFLSGWIALRYKNDADLALKHFNKLASLAPTRTDKARAAYWIGRAEIVRGNKAAARSSFQAASKYTTIYYGQLAREHIGLGRTPEEISSGKAAQEAINRVSKDEVVRAFQLVRQAGNKDQLNLFLWSLAQRFDKQADMNAVASIVSDAGGLNMALRFAKAAGQRGVDIDSWAYPIRGLPDWKPLGKPVEKPLVFALSRQESEFNATAGSPAGARGLMQLLPSTARLVARQHRVGLTPNSLLDPHVNVRLGSAHLADLVADYGGSYILTLVAYNAGPRRASEWVAAYGDPRSEGVDPIDWVESIPFQETRQYVQKVLQNVHIYRSRLAPQTVKPMSADLRRGGAPGSAVASTSEPEPVGCDGRSIAALAVACE
jgi:soluble lytic murein transglycosylase